MGPAGKWGWLFQTPQFFGPTTDPLDGASALGGADFNGDGKGDLALQGHPSFLDTAEIYLGNGDGTFSKANNYPLGNSPQLNSFGIAIADFNGDGKADIAASNVVLLGNGDGTFQGKTQIGIADSFREPRKAFVIEAN
jgi:hypothetical protein